MRRKKSQYYRLFTLALVFCLCSLWSAAATADLVSKPGEYSGYSEVLYDEWVRSSQYVEVEDGTKLAVVIYRPAVDGVAVDTPYPVVFMQTQYGRGSQGADMVNALTPYGYVVAVGDPRGLGASYGTRRASWGMDEAWDTHDLIEWLADQPWCDGNVGMWGGSYMGGIQVLTAATLPPHLKAIFPAQTPFDQYDELYTIIPPRGPLGELSNMARDLASLPVDGDVDGNGDGYPDMLYEAVQQHQPHYDLIQAYAGSLGQTAPPYSQVGISPYRDSMGPLVDSQFFYESSASSYIDEIGQSGAGVYNMGYWNNWLRRGSISAFVNLSNPSKLLMTASSRMPNFSFTTEHLRFFDYWLKGIDNGIMDEPPIFYNVLSAPEGKDWRFAWQWPLPNQNNKALYLAQGPSGSANPGVNDGILTAAKPSAQSGEDVYTVFYGITQANRDVEGLTYTMEPLEDDMDVIGHPVIQLWISSDHDDGDFVANLEEVDGATGASAIISTGKLRASLRKIADPPFDYMGLPWRRALEEDEQKLIPGKPVRLLFDLLPVSKVFKEGNRIRLNIVCESPPDTPVLSPSPVISLYRNKKYKSFISLPVTTDPLEVKVRINPAALNLKYKGLFTAFIAPPKDLPKGYRAEDIDISTVTCGGAPAIGGKVVKNTLIAQFDKNDLTDIPTCPKAKLIVQGEFNYEIPFEGSDRIRVINWGKKYK